MLGHLILSIVVLMQWLMCFFLVVLTNLCQLDTK
jgi:hypothetical protein